MGNLWQLLNGLRMALLQSPRLALTAIMAIATLAPFAGLVSAILKDRRPAKPHRSSGR